MAEAMHDDKQLEALRELIKARKESLKIEVASVGVQKTLASHGFLPLEGGEGDEVGLYKFDLHAYERARDDLHAVACGKGCLCGTLGTACLCYTCQCVIQ